MSRANQNVNLEEVGSFFTTKEEREMNGRVLFLATAKLVVLHFWAFVGTYKLNVVFSTEGHSYVGIFAQQFSLRSFCQ